MMHRSAGLPRANRRQMAAAVEAIIFSAEWREFSNQPSAISFQKSNLNRQVAKKEVVKVLLIA